MQTTVKMLKNGKEKAMPESHAKILVKLGRAEYLTRDMVAAPLSASLVSVSGGVELDSTGAAWDASIHAESKVKNANGAWRKKSGARSSES